MKILGYDRRERALKSALRQALECERARIGPEQAGVIDEFLNHGEFGLAHNQLTDALSDRELVPLDQTAKLLDEATRLMGTDH